MTRIIFLLSIAALLFFISADSSLAQNRGCQPIYGGGLNCLAKGDLEIDKKVQRPGSTNYTDNLSQIESYYSPTVNFQITVKNTGNKKLENAILTDIFPKNFSFVSGPGKYDSSKNSLTLKLSLDKGQTKTITISTRTEKKDRSLECFTNFAEIKLGKNQSDDNSRFCVGQIGVSPTQPTDPVKSPPSLSETPGTGPELFGLLALVPAAATGLYLRRKSA